MATRGPKGDAHNLRVIKGMAKAGQRIGSEPTRSPRNAPPEPPPMSAAAREFWDFYAPRMTRAGILDDLDREALYHLCEFGALCRRVLTELEDADTIVDSERGTKSNPRFQIARDNVNLFRMLSSELGLNPTARARLNLPEPKELSELDRLLGDVDD